MPALTPDMNREPTDTPVAAAYMISVMLGGMISATEPDDVISPAEKPSG